MSDKNNYNSNSSNNKNKSDIYKKIEEAKGTIFKDEINLGEGNIATLLEKAEGKSPTLLVPVDKSKIVFDKPICDPIGFKQHEGECANDAFQQVILFADDLKDITQAKMFDNTLLDKIDDSELKKYINYMQKRFIEHYGLITGQTTEKAKRRMSFIASHVCHEFFPDQTIEKRLDDYKDIKNALGLGKYSLEINGKIDGPGYIMSTNIYRQKGEELVLDERVGHVVGLFKCGGNYYYYDNETRIKEINKEIYKKPREWRVVRAIESGEDYIVRVKGWIRSKRTGEVIGMRIGGVWEEGEWKEAKWLEELQKTKKFMIMEADNMIVIRRRKAITIRRSKEKGKDKSLTKKTTKHAATRKMAKSK